MQNFAFALFDAPHEGHCSGSGAAHPSQNFARAGFSEPHFEHRIESPESEPTWPFLYHSVAAKGLWACRVQLDATRLIWIGAASFIKSSSGG
jgi:hypothetical protein